MKEKKLCEGIYDKPIPFVDLVQKELIDKVNCLADCLRECHKQLDKHDLLRAKVREMREAQDVRDGYTTNLDPSESESEYDAAFEKASKAEAEVDEMITTKENGK